MSRHSPSNHSQPTKGSNRSQDLADLLPPENQATEVRTATIDSQDAAAEHHGTPNNKAKCRAVPLQSQRNAGVGGDGQQRNAIVDEVRAASHPRRLRALGDTSGLEGVCAKGAKRHAGRREGGAGAENGLGGHGLGLVTGQWVMLNSSLIRIRARSAFSRPPISRINRVSLFAFAVVLFDSVGEEALSATLESLR